jgi:hypothetical protein
MRKLPSPPGTPNWEKHPCSVGEERFECRNCWHLSEVYVLEMVARFGADALVAGCAQKLSPGSGRAFRCLPARRSRIPSDGHEKARRVAGPLLLIVRRSCAQRSVNSRREDRSKHTQQASSASMSRRHRPTSDHHTSARDRASVRHANGRQADRSNCHRDGRSNGRRDRAFGRQRMLLPGSRGQPPQPPPRERVCVTFKFPLGCFHEAT